jgi:hypothetical protein
MTRTELSDLDRRLAQGPQLVTSAVLGAGVGAVIGWLSGRGIAASAGQGVVGGVVVGLLVYGAGQWQSSESHKRSEGHLAGFLAPFPLHSRSVTYPWSAH